MPNPPRREVSADELRRAIDSLSGPKPPTASELVKLVDAGIITPRQAARTLGYRHQSLPPPVIDNAINNRIAFYRAQRARNRRRRYIWSAILPILAVLAWIWSIYAVLVMALLITLLVTSYRSHRGR